jgi:hypothetical protein
MSPVRTSPETSPQPSISRRLKENQLAEISGFLAPDEVRFTCELAAFTFTFTSSELVAWRSNACSPVVHFENCMRWSCTKLLKPNFLMGLKSLSN